MAYRSMVYQVGLSLFTFVYVLRRHVACENIAWKACRILVFVRCVFFTHTNAVSCKNVFRTRFSTIEILKVSVQRINMI
jgi:hypothetical protein